MYLKYDQVITCICIHAYLIFLYMYQPQLLFKSIISICVHVSDVRMCLNVYLYTRFPKLQIKKTKFGAYGR